MPGFTVLLSTISSQSCSSFGSSSVNLWMLLLTETQLPPLYSQNFSFGLGILYPTLQEGTNLFLLTVASSTTANVYFTLMLIGHGLEQHHRFVGFYQSHATFAESHILA